MEQEQVNKKPIMKVCMFGGLTIEFAGSPVSFARSSSTKFIQLLLLLLIHSEQGIYKKQLISCLYSWDSEGNHNKNLNSVIYRLKKQLIAAGFPNEEYIVLDNGICRWKSSFPVEVDVICFEKLVDDAFKEEGKEQGRMLEEAEHLYKGEFLPLFSTELWVIERNLHYKKLYHKVVEQLGSQLNQEENYQKERRLYQKAARIYPYDEWQVKEIDCLLAMKEYKEAYMVYQETTRIYCEEMGIPPGERLLGRLRMLEQQMRNPIGGFEDIQKRLLECQEEGAYYCHFPSFLDSSRLLARMAERSGTSIFLMLCNLSEYKGKEFTDNTKLEFQMGKLKQVITRTLRKGDLFTRYSRSQYLFILLGLEQENGMLVFKRLLDNWREEEQAQGELSYSITSLIQLTNPELVHQDTKPSWKKNTKKWGS